jgi:hypothetical protein
VAPARCSLLLFVRNLNSSATCKVFTAAVAKKLRSNVSYKMFTITVSKKSFIAVAPARCSLLHKKKFYSSGTCKMFTVTASDLDLKNGNNLKTGINGGPRLGKRTALNRCQRPIA